MKGRETSIFADVSSSILPNTPHPNVPHPNTPHQNTSDRGEIFASDLHTDSVIDVEGNLASNLDGNDKLASNIIKLAEENFKHSFWINGEVAKQSEMLEMLPIFYLTPQIEKSVVENSRNFRMFFDKMIANFYPSHVKLLNAYEALKAERKKILTCYENDVWLSLTEAKMAEKSCSIAAHRIDICNIINKAVADLPIYQFKLQLNNPIEDFLAENSALKTEVFIKENLRNSREADKIANKTNFGIHRLEAVIIDSSQNLPIELCSTGQQKLCLVSFMLAAISSFMAKFLKQPIILFDEIFTHLDEANRKILLDFLLKNNLQTFLTAINKEDFHCQKIEEAIYGQDFQFFNIETKETKEMKETREVRERREVSHQ